MHESASAASLDQYGDGWEIVGRKEVYPDLGTGRGR
jgi:hypothetical protein